MFFQQARLIVLHAVPMLVAQLVAMGMMITDTVVLGHYGTEDLAAVAVGGGIYVAVLFALTGVLQAVSPTVSQLKGAGRDGEIAGALQQCFWLALCFAVPGVLILLHPDPLLSLSNIDAGVEMRARLPCRACLGNSGDAVLSHLLRFLQRAGSDAAAGAHLARQHLAARALVLVSGQSWTGRDRGGHSQRPDQLVYGHLRFLLHENWQGAGALPVAT